MDNTVTLGWVKSKKFPPLVLVEWSTSSGGYYSSSYLSFTISSIRVQAVIGAEINIANCTNLKRGRGRRENPMSKWIIRVQQKSYHVLWNTKQWVEARASIECTELPNSCSVRAGNLPIFSFFSALLAAACPTNHPSTPCPLTQASLQQRDTHLPSICSEHTWLDWIGWRHKAALILILRGSCCCRKCIIWFQCKC